LAGRDRRENIGVTVQKIPGSEDPGYSNRHSNREISELLQPASSEAGFF
jgi:hypothetical protein